MRLLLAQRGIGRLGRVARDEAPAHQGDHLPRPQGKTVSRSIDVGPIPSHELSHLCASASFSTQVQMSPGHPPAHSRRLPSELRRHCWPQAHERQPQSPTPPRHGSLGRSNKRTMHYKKMTTEESNPNPNFIWVPLSKLLQHCIPSAYVPAFSQRHLSLLCRILYYLYGSHTLHPDSRRLKNVCSLRVKGK